LACLTDREKRRGQAAARGVAIVGFVFCMVGGGGKECAKVERQQDIAPMLTCECVVSLCVQEKKEAEEQQRLKVGRPSVV
jgi:hypothetical protein